MLATRKDDKGAPLLLSNALTDDASNLSYAREFAKIVARLDLLAEVLGERYRRISVNYAQDCCSCISCRCSEPMLPG